MSQTKKLHLSKEHRAIAGVCGGLAEYFETDPVLIRLIFLFFTLMGGSGILFYILLWIFIGYPKEVRKVEDSLQNNFHDHHGRSSGVIGFFLILIGAMFLLENYFPEFGIRRFWPLLLILLGLAMITRHQD